MHRHCAFKDIGTMATRDAEHQAGTQSRNQGVMTSQGWLQRTSARDAGGEDLTFVLVGLGLDAEDGDHHDDDHDGGGGQGHHKPHLAVERLSLEIPELKIDLGWRLDLKYDNLNRWV